MEGIDNRDYRKEELVLSDHVLGSLSAIYRNFDLGRKNSMEFNIHYAESGCTISTILSFGNNSDLYDQLSTPQKEFVIQFFRKGQLIIGVKTDEYLQRLLSDHYHHWIQIYYKQDLEHVLRLAAFFRDKFTLALKCLDNSDNAVRNNERFSKYTKSVDQLPTLIKEYFKYFLQRKKEGLYVGTVTNSLIADDFIGWLGTTSSS